MGERRKILGITGLAVAIAVVPVVAPAAAGAATFTAHGSVEQVYVAHAPPGDGLDLRDGTNHTVAHGTADDLGSFLFRDVAPGDGYTVRDGGQSSGPLH